MNHNKKNSVSRSEADLADLGEAVQTFLVPLARMLVRAGFNANGMKVAVESAYVIAAREYLSEKGWPYTTGRLAVFAGVNRSRVESVEEDLSESTGIEPSKWNQITRLLTVWHLDQRYVLPMVGEPRDLSYRGGAPREVSFLSLARECAPHLKPDDLLDELLRVGAAQIVPEPEEEEVEGRSEGERKILVRVLKRAYVPEPYDASSIERLGRIFAALAETLDGNFSRKGTPDERFERQVNADFPISPADEMEFSELARSRGQKMLEELDSWLAGRRRVEENGRRVGVEVFHFLETGIKDSPPEPVSDVEENGEPGVIDTLSFLKS